MKKIKLSQFIIALSAILCICSLPLLNFSSSQTTLNIGEILNTVKDKHIARLYELTLSGSTDVTLTIANNDNVKQLNITNGVVVGSGSSSESDLSSIGGGINNTIRSNSSHAGIAGGINNEIKNGENSVIGGGSGNRVEGYNGVVAGGQGNRAGSLGVVAGGNNNSATGNGVALGGQSNNAGENSLAMGSGAGGKHAFARNAQANDYSARIDAKSGVLIGTTKSIPGVNLVVSGAVKIKSNNNPNGQAGEIRVVSGCFYAYDGAYRHVISQTINPENCSGFVPTQSCQFGNVNLQQGDQVTGYNETISSSCDGRKVVCSGGILITVQGKQPGYDNPYCHNI